MALTNDSVSMSDELIEANKSEVITKAEQKLIDKINNAWRDSVTGIRNCAHWVREYHQKYPIHWDDLFKSGLVPFGEKTAYKLINIDRCEWLQKVDETFLPAKWTTLFELSQFDANDAVKFIGVHIRADMKGGDILEMKKQLGIVKEKSPNGDKVKVNSQDNHQEECERAYSQGYNDGAKQAWNQGAGQCPKCGYELDSDS